MKGKRGVMIALACTLCLAGMVFFLWKQGVIVADHSAEYTGNLYWNGRVYTSIADCPYKSGRALAKTKDGNWTVYALKEDPSHTFVLLSTFLDQYLFVAEDYSIPKTGRITKRSGIEKSLRMKPLSMLFHRLLGRNAYLLNMRPRAFLSSMSISA